MKRLRPAVLSSLFLVLICVCTASAQSADDQDAEPEMKSKPKIFQMVGNWSGTDDAQDPGAGNCNGCPMTLDVTRQDAKNFSGSFSLTTADEEPAGTMTGTVSGNNVKMTFQAKTGTKNNCKATVVATLDPENNSMSGAWLTKGKGCKGKGTFDVIKQ
jgi:hypothetical protein